MKKTFIILALAALAFTSCSKNSGSNLIQAIVTVYGEKPAKCTMHLDDNTVLVPDNVTANPYMDGCRALTLYQDLGETEPNTNDGLKYRKVHIERLDSVLTKNLAPNLGDDNDAVYGTAPIDTYRSWLTVVEDGFVTLHFTGLWGYPGTVHTINLVKDTDAEDPFHFQLRHNNNGDVTSPYRRCDGVVAFNIKEMLEKHPGQGTYDITLTYNSIAYGPNHNVTFHYTPGSTAILGSDESNVSLIFSKNIE